MDETKKSSRINNWLYLDDPNESEVGFDRRFSVPITLAGAIFSFLSIFGNQFIHLNSEIIDLTFISFGAYILFYLLLYYNVYVKAVKYFVIVFTLFIINALWYYNHGANGPVLYLFLMLYSYLIFMLKGKQLLFFSIIIALNIAVLFYIEYYNPHLITNYSSQQQQLEDTYISTVFYGIIAFVIMYMAKTSFIQAYNAAKEADKLKAAFLENISHEIRTPLNAIVGFSSMLASGELDEKDKSEYTSYIKESNKAIFQLVNDILDVSLIESKQLELKEETMNVTEIIKTVEKKYNEKLNSLGKDKEVAIKLEIPQENIFMTGDPLRLKQVIENLVDNAVKFTEKGSVTIGLKEEKEALYFFVKDTGIGFPAELKDKIFNQFYKLSTSKDRLFSGTGMGLFISEQLVLAMGGTIGADSKDGQGSLFYFKIPKKDFKKVTINNKDKSEEKAFALHQFDPKTKPFTVLVVDDNPQSQVYFKNLLQLMDAVVVLANNGKEAIDLFKSKKDFDLVLLDLRMPEMDGFKTLQILRTINPSTPVVAQTAYVMNNYKEKCKEAGFDAFIEKPVTKEMLLKVFKQLGFLN